MKHTRRSLLSPQRLQRISLWLALSIAWFAAHVLARIAPHAAARALTEHARLVRLMLMLHAVRISAFRRGVMHADMRSLTGRAAAGGGLRRALRAGTPSQRARVLCEVLAAPERWIAHIVKRLRRGFSKLRRLPAPRRTQARAIAAAPCPAEVINSS